jgi:hypothetical protein
VGSIPQKHLHRNQKTKSTKSLSQANQETTLIVTVTQLQQKQNQTKHCQNTTTWHLSSTTNLVQTTKLLKLHKIQICSTFW